MTLTVQATTAAVVKIHAASAYAGPIQINQNGALEMFSIDPSGNVWHDWQLAADVPNSGLTNWNGWTDNLSGVLSTGSAAVVKNLNNTLEVFVPSSTGDVYHNWQLTPGGNWNGWSDLGGKRHRQPAGGKQRRWQSERVWHRNQRRCLVREPKRARRGLVRLDRFNRTTNSTRLCCRPEPQRATGNLRCGSSIQRLDQLANGRRRLEWLGRP